MITGLFFKQNLGTICFATAREFIYTAARYNSLVVHFQLRQLCNAPVLI